MSKTGQNVKSRLGREQISAAHADLNNNEDGGKPPEPEEPDNDDDNGRRIRWNGGFLQIRNKVRKSSSAQKSSTQEATDFENDAVLDAGSAFTSCHNPKLLDDVCETSDATEMQANIGKRTIDEKGTLHGFSKEVWPDKKSVANTMGFVEAVD